MVLTQGILMRRLLTTILLLIPLETASASIAPVTLQEPVKNLTLAPYLEILEDKTGEGAIEDALGLWEDRFTPPPKTNLNFGFTQSHVWGRVTLVNPSDQPLTLVLTGRYPSTDFVTVYVPAASESGRYTALRGGGSGKSIG